MWLYEGLRDGLKDRREWDLLDPDSGNFLDQTHGVFQIYPKYQINYRIKKIKN